MSKTKIFVVPQQFRNSHLLAKQRILNELQLLFDNCTMTLNEVADTLHFDRRTLTGILSGTNNFTIDYFIVLVLFLTAHQKKE